MSFLLFILGLHLAYVNVHSLQNDTTTRLSITKQEFIKQNSDTTHQESQAIETKKAKKRKHSKWMALFYSAFPSPFFPLVPIGFLGIHRLYLGHNKTGKLMLYIGGTIYALMFFIAVVLMQFFNLNNLLPVLITLVSLLIPLAIWALIDSVRILTGNLKFKDGTPTEW